MMGFRPSRLRRRVVLAACFALVLWTPTGVGAAQSGADLEVFETRERPSIDTLIAEAARRFGVPEAWIRAVMRQESAFDPTATSRAGAMGLMQVMPATYAELRRRYGLGPDPYAPRDNVLAGAAYLRELHDRFGPEGMLAAYNAGPGRYLQHLEEGRPLPAETRDYVARITARIGTRPAVRRPRATANAAPDPDRAPLFPNPGPGEDPAASALFAPLFTADAASGTDPE